MTRPPRLAIAAVLLAGGTAAPAAAQVETFSLPEGCEAFVTVQLKSCTVQHAFTCEGDPEGYIRRVDLGEEGMEYAGMIDRETQWIESFHVSTQHSESLEAAPADPASFSELVSAGEDSFDFITESDEIGETRYVGRDALTGVVETIDGVTLHQTEYDITAYGPDGSEEWRATGNEWISKEWRMFLSGTSHIETPTEAWDVDDSPVEFMFPGEPGFLSANPKFGCGALMSKSGGQQ
ncbi:hypothetical protein OG2516_10421 [Oceanicola granulosus HTCC2516]|uniref:Uncharacterized protein n=1 Tax=Oceanicola granulosus (strain ATCC BAA-861 / DSM 15982 / KCTC 12143 / HTCC2516) TaxID=314256 RepID=Q2CKB9_OCEGH|nr:hypothetical protein [Oceanicola granulosus]EAR52870.1 hypothetical protein OG2516_10421 [Oceanicola granulosus HTCC2516]